MKNTKENQKISKIDLTNQRCGKLVITKRAPDVIGNYHNIRKEMWYANCDCGTKNFLVSANEFKRKRIKSCGCERVKDYTGYRFGRLIVTRKAEPAINKDGKKIARYYCDCDCGTKDILVYLSNLKAGYTTSCGCYRSEQTNIRCKQYNTYEFKDDYVIGFDKNNNKFYLSIEDYDKVKDFCWHVDANDRVVTNPNKAMGTKYIKMHQLILNTFESDQIVDHKNHITRDNRRCNLRLGKQSNNMQNVGVRSNNTSGIPGVVWWKTRNKWVARITVNKKVISLGNYNNKEDAIRARKEAESKYFGEWNYDNSINSCDIPIEEKKNESN